MDDALIQACKEILRDINRFCAEAGAIKLRS